MQVSELSGFSWEGRGGQGSEGGMTGEGIDGEGQERGREGSRPSVYTIS